MTTKIHRFAVNVPNPAAKRVGVVLRLERATGIDLKPYGAVSSRALKVAHAGIARGPCADKGEERIKLTVAARSSVDVYVVIEAETGAKPGAAIYNLVDNRGGLDIGGVMVACVDPPLVDAPGQLVKSRKPSPLALAHALYAVRPGEDPAKPASAAVLAGLTEFDLVAPITPASKQVLTDVKIYLEHLGRERRRLRSRYVERGHDAARRRVLCDVATDIVVAGVGAVAGERGGGAARFDPVRLDAVLRIMSKRGDRVGVRKRRG